MHGAKWWETDEEGKIHCFLCPRHCHISEGKAGFCGVRANEAGTLYSLVHSRPSAVNVDPIEKKPLFHWMPGTTSFSIGTTGCNLGCRFCQNAELARARAARARVMDLPPAKAVELARAEGCSSLSFTYNEPTIWSEYAIDLARLARDAGLGATMVTNGYITPEARAEVYPWIDAANVDLKGFAEEFYEELTVARLAPVLDTIEWLHNETDVWLEITNLIIPTWNDDPDQIERMVGWVLEHLGPDVPLHLTAFHPAYKMTDLPRTPGQTLRRARRQALDQGLHYVYLGNIHDDGAHTYCPSCGECVIERSWHTVERIELADGRCRFCGQPVAVRTCARP